MLRSMSGRLLSEWMVFYRLEPWGSQEEEYLAAMITSMVANTARDAEQTPEPFGAKDFMRDLEQLIEDEESDDTDDEEKLMAQLNFIFGSMYGAGRI